MPPLPAAVIVVVLKLILQGALAGGTTPKSRRDIGAIGLALEADRALRRLQRTRTFSLPLAVG